MLIRCQLWQGERIDKMTTKALNAYRASYCRQSLCLNIDTKRWGDQNITTVWGIN